MNYPTGDIANLLTPERREQDMHVRTVHPSCLEVHGVKLRLSRLLIDDTADLGKYRVNRVSNDTYAIRGMRFSFTEALAILEGRAPLPAKEPKTRIMKVLPLNDLPLFALLGVKS